MGTPKTKYGGQYAPARAGLVRIELTLNQLELQTHRVVFESLRAIKREAALSRLQLAAVNDEINYRKQTILWYVRRVGNLIRSLEMWELKLQGQQAMPPAAPVASTVGVAEVVT